MVGISVNEGQERFVFSKRIIEHALFLREVRGLKWAVIAERIGCKQSSLQNTITYYRQGRWKGMYDARRQRLAFLEEKISQGYSVKEMAEMLGMDRKHLKVYLWYQGLDAEVRAEMRAAEKSRTNAILPPW